MLSLFYYYLEDHNGNKFITFCDILESHYYVYYVLLCTCDNVIMPPPTLVEGGIMFSGCPSVRPCVLPLPILVVRYLPCGFMDLHKIIHGNSLVMEDVLISFW